MGFNDFGGKFVVFGSNICRNEKEGGKRQVGYLGVLLFLKSLACVFWKRGVVQSY